VRPMLDDLELPQVQEIVTRDHRSLAEHKLPGMDGSLFQNLGRSATVLVVHGIATGPDVPDFLQKLEDKFRAGAPVPFTADIVAEASIDRIVIDDLRLEEKAGLPERVSYTLSLREHIEPVAPANTSAVDEGILGDAGDLVGGLIEGLNIGPEFLSGLSDFAGALGDLLDRLQRFKTAIQSASH
jgi:hypothetical protein